MGQEPFWQSRKDVSTARTDPASGRLALGPADELGSVARSVILLSAGMIPGQSGRLERVNQALGKKVEEK